MSMLFVCRRHIGSMTVSGLQNAGFVCMIMIPSTHTAGVLTLISRKLVSSEDIRTISHVPDRTLQVRFPVTGVHADVFNCYQIPWTTRGGT